MTRYASETKVPVERSRGELEVVLARYGADCFAYMSEPGRSAVGFRAHGRSIRMVLPLPTRPETTQVAHRKWEQACRQRWRALVLCVKAKLEAVESGIATFDDEFLAYTVLPNGETVGQWATPQLDQMAERGMPTLLLPDFRDG